MDKEIKMPNYQIEDPDDQKYSDKVNAAYEATQEEEGMTNENVAILQELLRYYPENKNLSIDGQYGEDTVKAVNSFYDNYFWTPARRLQKAKDTYGEKYIMQSEMDAMRESFPDTTDKKDY